MADTEQSTGTQQVGEMTPDPHNRSCPSRGLLKSLGDLWIVLVVGASHEAGQPQRFKEISTRVDGISTKILTQILRGLERDGLIERHQYPKTPSQATYELIDSDKGLAKALSYAGTQVTEHLGAVSQARVRYDTEH